MKASRWPNAADRRPADRTNCVAAESRFAYYVLCETYPGDRCKRRLFSLNRSIQSVGSRRSSSLPSAFREPRDAELFFGLHANFKRRMQILVVYKQEDPDVPPYLIGLTLRYEIWEVF
ncbi:hypothetical protein L596_027807 [Steinernema carpocapsae]|uniref:Uncharacterized protein n=1 Tax=Steinernema carpocapsae TaxID=34508 RepID=A0A4U5LWM1_STECR|nr:hypothetical protein L596_027807 [Steinernema carpocapsae]